MRIAFIFLISIYLIIGPIIGRGFPELEFEGNRPVVNSQVRRLTSKELIDYLQWRMRFELFIKWMLFLLAATGSDHSYVLVILGLKFFEGEKFHLDHRIEAYKRGDKVIINYLQPTRVELELKDEQLIESEIIRLCSLKDISGHKYVTQEEIGRLFGISRQMINRRKRVVDANGLSSLLRGEL